MTDPKQDLPALIARVRDDAWGSACSDRGPVETAKLLATALEEQMAMLKEAEDALLEAQRERDALQDKLDAYEPPPRPMRYA